MSDSASDPPRTLADAENVFKEFLAQNGYPRNIRWVTADDVVLDDHGRFWIREHHRMASEQAGLRYSAGVVGNRGIALRAVCATDTETIATVFVPANDLDAQYAPYGTRTETVMSHGKNHCF